MIKNTTDRLKIIDSSLRYQWQVSASIWIWDFSLRSKWHGRRGSRGRGIGRKAPDSPTPNKPVDTVISTKTRSEAKCCREKSILQCHYLIMSKIFGWSLRMTRACDGLEEGGQVGGSAANLALLKTLMPCHSERNAVEWRIYLKEIMFTGQQWIWILEFICQLKFGIWFFVMKQSSLWRNTK